MATRRGNVVPLAAFEDDRGLCEGLRAGHPAAVATLFDRYVGHVERVLVRVLGPDRELRDLIQDVFVGALENAADLRDDSSLKAWLTSITVFTARKCIRKRTRWRWLSFMGAVPEVRHTPVSPTVTEAVRATLAVLERLPVDERIPFALRHVDGMELTEVASACGVSLATIKRRLAKAEQRFARIAADQPALHDWMEGGARWETR